ncbi:hypothetical protein DW712_02380 [Bacteroides intestinalis]|uniref:Uncharacterized protein n=1 Tax=Bacteroides intestinalis TaxID=329854 RepID=A0A414LLQ5_9BACE|nr:hypothetical protein DW712_02380 [Bacteroides intestinalis]
MIKVGYGWEVFMDEEMEKASFYINFPFDESLFFYRANLQTLLFLQKSYFIVTITSFSASRYSKHNGDIKIYYLTDNFCKEFTCEQK